MSNDPNAQQEQMAQLQMQMAEHAKSLGQIVNAGREQFGEAEFDSMSAEVAGYIGVEKMPEFGLALANTDRPAELVEYLSHNPDVAKEISKMSGPRKTVALERIQARISPNSTFQEPSAIPSWKKNAGDRGSLMDDSISDEQWYARWKRKNGVK